MPKTERIVTFSITSVIYLACTLQGWFVGHLCRRLSLEWYYTVGPIVTGLVLGACINHLCVGRGLGGRVSRF